MGVRTCHLYALPFCSRKEIARSLSTPPSYRSGVVFETKNPPSSCFDDLRRDKVTVTVSFPRRGFVGARFRVLTPTLTSSLSIHQRTAYLFPRVQGRGVGRLFHTPPHLSKTKKKRCRWLRLLERRSLLGSFCLRFTELCNSLRPHCSAPNLSIYLACAFSKVGCPTLTSLPDVC